VIAFQLTALHFAFARSKQIIWARIPLGIPFSRSKSEMGAVSSGLIRLHLTQSPRNPRKKQEQEHTQMWNEITKNQLNVNVLPQNPFPSAPRSAMPKTKTERNVYTAVCTNIYIFYDISDNLWCKFLTQKLKNEAMARGEASDKLSRNCIKL